MSRRIDTSIASVQFQVDARQASASMQALQDMANRLNKDIDSVNKNIANLGKDVPKDNPQLLAYQQQLNGLNSDLKDVIRTQKDFMRGAKAADQLWKAAGDGTIESLSFRSIRTGINGLKKRQEGLQPGDAQDMKDWRIIKQVIEEADRVVKAAGADVQHVVQTIREGGKVSEQTMRQTINTLRDLKGSVDETEAEFRAWGSDLDFMEAKMQEFNEAQRRAKGEIVDANDARREMNKLTAEGAAAAEKEAKAAELKIASLKEEGRVLAENRTQIKKNIEATQEQMDKMQEDIEKKHNYVESLGGLWAEDQKAIYEGNVNDAKRKAQAERELANQKSDAAEQQKRYTEVLTQKTEELEQKVVKLNEQLTAVQQQATTATKEQTEAYTEQEAELARLKKELKDVRIYRENAETMKETAEKALGGKKIWDNERYIKAREEDVAASQEAIKKIDDKWDAYWNKQEENAKQFAEVLKKSLEDVRYEDFQKHVTGPNAELAKSWYRFDTRDSEGLEIWSEDNQKGRDLSFLRSMKKAGGASEEQLEELRLLEGLKRKWEDYWKVRDKAERERPKSDAVFEELDKYNTQIIQADVAIENSTKRALELKQKIADKEKEIAESKQQNVQTTKSEAEALKELEDAQKGLVRHQEELKKYEGWLQGNLDALKELGLTEEDLADETKVREAAEKKVLEILEAQARVGEEVAEQKRKLTGEVKMSQLGGTKAEQEFYAKNKSLFNLEDYDNVDDAMERIAHLEMVSKLKNGKKFSDETSWDPDYDELDDDEAIVMTDRERQNAQDELRVLKQHIREQILKAIHEIGDVDKALEEVTGSSDGVSEDAKFGEQLNEKIEAIKDKISENIKTSVEKYNDILDDELHHDEPQTKEELSRIFNGTIRNINESIGSYRDSIGWEKEDIEKSQELVAAKQQELDAIRQGTQATKEQTEAQAESHKQDEEELRLKGELEKAQKDLTTSKENQNKAEQESIRLQGEAAEQEKIAAKAESDLAQAENTLVEKQAEINRQQDEALAEIGKMGEEYEGLKTKMEGYEQQLEENGKAYADNAQQQIDAEAEKAQAQQLTIKRMEEMLAVLQKEYREEELTAEQREEHIKQIQQLEKAISTEKAKPVLQMMTDRMGDLGKLSASALEETRRFWDAMVQGAEKGSEKLAAAEANVKALVEEERKRSEAQAGMVIGNMGSYSDKEIADAVKTFEQLRDAQTHGNEEWRKFNELAEQGKQHLEELAKADALAKMEERMSNLTNLSDAALAETKKYWEALKAGAEKGSEDLTKAETNLTRIIDLEKERTRIENERKAKIVSSGGDLNMYSEAEISEAIKAAKELHSHMASADPEARKLADSIAKAEAHIKQYGIEAARAAQRQEELDATMQKQFQTMMNGMRSGVMPSQTAVKSQMNYWQKLIDDPKTAAESLQFYRDQLAEVKKMYDFMIKSQGESALAWFQQGSDKDASGNQIKEMADKLKEYRGTLLKETNADEIAQIDAILQRIGASAKKATEELMDFEKAKELALQAGDDVYGEKNPAFLASPEEIKAATKSIENYRENLFKTIKTKKDLGEATDAEEAELKELAKYLKDLKFEQDNFNMSREKMESLMDTPVNAASIDELREAIKRADAELKRMEGSLGENNKEYQIFAEKVRNAKNTLKEMEGAAKASATAWEKAWSRLKTYVVMYMGFNAVWQKMMGTADDLMQLSDKMGEVRKTTGFTADEVGRLSDNLAKLDTRTNLTGLMEFSSLAGSIGLKTQEAVQGFTEAANMIAVSLPEMGNEASRTLIKIADATGDLEKNGGNVRETLERVGSTIIALRANSAAAAGPITDFVSRVGAVGAQAGISIDQIAALGATVDALGGRVEMSATALSRMIPAIKNNTFEVAKAIGMTEKELKNMTGMDQMVAIFRKLHDSAKGFDTSTEEGMNAMADSVEKALGRSTSMQEVMKELNQQGARAGIVFGLLSQNVDKLEEQLDTASEAYSKNIALMDEYNKMNDTTAAKWERLKNQLEEAFVSDYMQRLLGGIIEGLRALVDFFTDNGPLAKGLRYIIAYVVLFQSKWSEAFGKAMLSTWEFFKNFRENMAKIGESATSLGNKLLPAITSVKGLKAAWKGLNAEMKANIITAIATAIAYLVSVLWDWHKAAKEAAAEQGRFNDQIVQEQKNLKDLMEPLKNSNLAQEERSKLISEINSKYGKYLGYMLSEYSSAIQLADAHALIAKRIREEAYERRIAEKEKEIQGKHDEDVNAAYTKITERVRGSVRGGASAQEIADVLKGIVDNRIGEVRYAIDNANDIFATKYSYNLDPKIKAAIDGGIERLIADGKLSRDNTKLIRNAVYHYTVEAHEQHKDIMDQTANLRSDLRGIQGAIKVDLANNLNTLISNVANSVGNAVKKVQNKQQPQLSPYLQSPGSSVSRIPSLFGGGQQGGTSWQAPWKQDSRETTPEQQMAPVGWKPNINKKDVEEVRQFVKDQEALRGALEAGGQQIDEAQRRVAESWLLTDKELKEYKAIVEKADRGPGGSNNNPYGDYNKVTSPYSQWNGDDLVARRKEMLDRVRALANGADVQKVLSEDAKFISEAVRKNIKTTKDAIEWYNTERLKIQDALHEKHLTNTGDWLDPKKGGKKASKMVQDEMKYYLDELDAYYTERKAKIQEEQNDEMISEAEARNRTLALEGEWYQRRGNLQKLYSKERKEVAKEEKQDILDILSERTGDTTDYIKEDIKNTVKFIEKVGTEKGKPAMDRIYGDIDLGMEKSFLKSRNAIGKHMQDITNIVNKENPFNGIVEGLRKNLGTMDLLLTDITDDAKRTADKEIERTMFLLEQSTKGYGLTWQQLMRDMAEKGWQAWADAINSDSQMQSRLMHQVYQVFEKVQDAIKKEASELKKQADIMWSNILLPGGDGKTTIKDAFEQTIGALGIQEGRVSRANSLIGAGQASERVADKLAIQQMKVQLAMQQYQYNLTKKIAKEKIDALRKEAAEAEALNDKENARSLRMQADNAEQALNLATRKEQTEELKMQEQIIARTEESQARLYKELKEWSDLLTSSMKDIFEASHAGDKEYYNELAKMNLTGKGGPGAGTYIIIDNEGTSDAEAHYEYLDERQALERQREIERENAQAEAWKKMWDEINMKLSETITDQLNAMLQNQSIDANTSATLQNTAAIAGLTEAVQAQENKGSGGSNLMSDMAGATMADALTGGTTGTGTPREGGLTTEEAQEWINGMGDNPALYWAEQSNKARETLVENNKKIQTSTQSTFAKMTLAANMYGAAYQAMSNENLSMTQKFEMMALQAVGNYAIGALTTELAGAEAKAASDSPGVLGTLWKQLGWAAAPVFTIFTGLLGGLMGLASSKIGTAKSQIAQATGASVNAGRLSTGMMTYAEGNVNEFSDPNSLTPGRQYNVDGADGRTYRARYMGKGAKTHITNGPEFHLVGEKGREAIIDAHTTRNIQLNEPEIWRSIQTLYNGGSLRHSTRRGHGVSAYAEGNLDEFGMADGGGLMAEGMDLTSMRDSLDRNSAVQEALLERLKEPIVAQNILYGPDGLPATLRKLQKEAERHGEKYL